MERKGARKGDGPLFTATQHDVECRQWRDVGVTASWRRGGDGLFAAQRVVIVCDGTAEADKRIARALWNDPATGVMRHADAG